MERINFTKKVTAFIPVVVQTTNYDPGLYFVNLLQEGKSIETKKLIILR